MEKRMGCVVMAAGNSSRFGANKLAQEFGGKTLVERTLDAIPRGLFSVVAVVTQYDEVEQLAIERGFIPVRNRHPDWGISHTISLGLEQMIDCDGVMFTVSDQPMLTEETIRRVAATWCKAPQGIAAASHNGKRGNPCMFGAEFFQELRQLQEDHGGSAVIRRHESALNLVEADARELTDCDTPEQLESLKRQL